MGRWLEGQGNFVLAKLYLQVRGRFVAEELVEETVGGGRMKQN